MTTSDGYSSPEGRHESRRAAARGAALLDALDPDWRGRIDWDDLDMRDCSRCVVGQLTGVSYDGDSAAYVVGPTRLGVPYEEDHLYGFETGTENRYGDLRLAWLEVAGVGRQA